MIERPLCPCGKPIPHDYYESPKRQAERLFCSRQCAGIYKGVTRRPTEVVRMENPPKYFRCGGCGQRHEGQHRCVICIPALPWEVR
jgi:hypothetical protein